MLHEFRELPLPAVWAMSAEEFLQACNDYLEEALAEDKRMRDDAQARAYLRSRPELGLNGDDWNYWDSVC